MIFVYRVERIIRSSAKVEIEVTTEDMLTSTHQEIEARAIKHAEQNPEVFLTMPAGGTAYRADLMERKR